MNLLALNNGDPSEFRMMEYVGTNMEPTIPRETFVVIRPVDRFDHDGLYLVDTGSIYRCDRRIGGYVYLKNDCPHFGEGFAMLEPHFNECVRGKVTHILQCQDRTYMRQRAAVA